MEEILAWTEDQLGKDARRRYRLLLQQAIREVVRYPELAGSIPYPELGPDIRIYHIRHSRNKVVASKRVKNPRHFLMYRVAQQSRPVIGRILHDSMELSRHFLPD